MGNVNTVKTDRQDWAVYRDMEEIVGQMTLTQLLTMAQFAKSSLVAMACSDELARRRPGKRG